MTFLLLLACSTPASETTPAAPGVDATAPAKGSRTDTDLDGLATALEGKALVIDVRTQGEWDAGHVPGAVHIEMPVPPDHPILKEHGRDEPVYLICQSGGRSGRVADALAGAGYQTVNVKGGTGAWAQDGRPIEK